MSFELYTAYDNSTKSREEVMNPSLSTSSRLLLFLAIFCFGMLHMNMVRKVTKNYLSTGGGAMTTERSNPQYFQSFLLNSQRP
jgi:hypothetical protein